MKADDAEQANVETLAGPTSLRPKKQRTTTNKPARTSSKKAGRAETKKSARTSSKKTGTTPAKRRARTSSKKAGRAEATKSASAQAERAADWTREARLANTPKEALKFAKKAVEAAKHAKSE